MRTYFIPIRKTKTTVPIQYKPIEKFRLRLKMNFAERATVHFLVKMLVCESIYAEIPRTNTNKKRHGKRNAAKGNNQKSDERNILEIQ